MQSGAAIKNEHEMINKELKSKLIDVNNNALVIQEIINDYSNLINDVFDKIKSVQGIANKTNLLAINASIETIHASDLLASFENIVTKNLHIQARIIAELLVYDPDFMLQDGVVFAKECGIEEFYITDEQGIIRFTNQPAWNNEMLNSSDLLSILKDSELVIDLPSTGDGIDSEQFKIIGIGRKDQPGIIQIGAHFIRPKGQLAINGFGVVAREAKRLADASKEIASRVTFLTNELGNEISELKQTSKNVIDNINKNVEILNLNNNLEDQIKKQKNAMNTLIENILILDTNMRDIRKYFAGILSPLSELINIARQTNLLGVRAAIEAAHSTNDKQDFDNLLNKHMTIEAKLSSLYIERRPEITCDELIVFTKYIEIDEIWISDENATVELTNIPGGKGFVYLNEGQTAPYMKLLSNPNAIVTEPPARRALDGKVFKYVGIGRRGRLGIFQVGNASKLYGDSTAEGFSVVSKQIKTLAEQSREIAAEIETMVESMDLKAQKVIDQIKVIRKKHNEATNLLVE